MTQGRLSFAEAERLALAYAEEARRWTPRHLEELEGVAEGAGLPLSELLVPNCGEEFTADEAGEGGRRAPAPGGPRGGDHCTAVAVAAGGRHVIGHNMDWYVVDAPNNVMFDLTVPDGTRLMGIAGAPYLLMLAMNSHGVGNVSNSVHSNDNRVGVPNAFVRRASLEGALARGRSRPRPAGRASPGHQPLPRRHAAAASGTSRPRPRRAPSWTTRPPASWRTPTTTSPPRWRRSRR